jgi:hypothetical protein
MARSNIKLLIGVHNLGWMRAGALEQVFYSGKAPLAHIFIFASTEQSPEPASK